MSGLRVYVVETMPTQAGRWLALDVACAIRKAHRLMREWRAKYPKETFRVRPYEPAVAKAVRS